MNAQSKTTRCPNYVTKNRGSDALSSVVLIEGDLLDDHIASVSVCVEHPFSERGARRVYFLSPQLAYEKHHMQRACPKLCVRWPFVAVVQERPEKIIEKIIVRGGQIVLPVDAGEGFCFSFPEASKKKRGHELKHFAPGQLRARIEQYEMEMSFNLQMTS